MDMSSPGCMEEEREREIELPTPHAPESKEIELGGPGPGSACGLTVLTPNDGRTEGKEREQFRP